VSPAAEVVLGARLGAGGFATVFEATWRGSHVAVKCFEPAAQEAVRSLFGSSASLGGRGGGGGSSAGGPAPSPTAAAAAAPPHAGSSAVSWPSAPTRRAPQPNGAGSTFAQEVQLLSRIRHPNVLAVYALVRAPRMLIMELAPGGSLRALLRGAASLHALPWAARVRLLAGVAAGVEFLHAQVPPIIHRDLKSDNIVLGIGASGSLVPKVCDFGISALKGSRAAPGGGNPNADDGDDEQQPGAAAAAAAGTPAYMASEIARQQRITRWEAVDVYGFGCIAHDVAHANTAPPDAPAAARRASLDAQQPVGGGSAGSNWNAVQVLVQRELAGYVRHVAAHVPHALAALTHACLTVDTAARPSMGDARAALAPMEAEAHAWGG
jgi:serine/threonine protein kinase